MTFQCTQCGKCCMYMGDYIQVEKQVSRFEYIISSVSTGTTIQAVIDHDKREIPLPPGWKEENPNACSFLRPHNSKVLCTIHETTPDQCKVFRCVIFRILTKEGVEAGKVTGARVLHSDDKDLRKIWDEGLKKTDWSGTYMEEKMARYLTENGYEVI